jgi:hypothetical protein
MGNVCKTKYCKIYNFSYIVHAIITVQKYLNIKIYRKQSLKLYHRVL